MHNFTIKNGDLISPKLKGGPGFLHALFSGQASPMSAFPLAQGLSRGTKQCSSFFNIYQYPVLVVSSKDTPRRCEYGSCAGMYSNDLKACRVPSADQKRLKYWKTTLLRSVNERPAESTCAMYVCGSKTCTPAPLDGAVGAHY